MSAAMTWRRREGNTGKRDSPFSSPLKRNNVFAAEKRRLDPPAGTAARERRLVGREVCGAAHLRRGAYSQKSEKSLRKRVLPHPGRTG